MPPADINIHHDGWSKEYLIIIAKGVIHFVHFMGGHKRILSLIFFVMSIVCDPPILYLLALPVFLIFGLFLFVAYGALALALSCIRWIDKRVEKIVAKDQSTGHEMIGNDLSGSGTGIRYAGNWRLDNRKRVEESANDPSTDQDKRASEKQVPRRSLTFAALGWMCMCFSIRFFIKSFEQDGA